MVTRLGGDLDKFVQQTSTAFWRNTLLYATNREIIPRTKGTIGGANTSTLNPPGSPVMTVIQSQGQSIVITIDKKGKIVDFTSDRSIQKQFPNADELFALVLNDSDNESVAIGVRPGPDGEPTMGFTLYAGPQSIPVSEEAIRKRLRPLRSLDDPEIYAEARGCRHYRAVFPGCAALLWVWARSSNRGKMCKKGRMFPIFQPATEVLRIFIQKAIYDRIRKRIGSNERSLPKDLENQIWLAAEPLSRSASWARTRQGREVQLIRAADKIAQEITDELIARAAVRAR